MSHLSFSPSMRRPARSNRATSTFLFCFKLLCAASVLSGLTLTFQGQSTISSGSAEKLIAGGHFDEALKQLDTLQEQNSPRILYLRGLAFYLKGEMTRAASAFAASADSDPKNLDAVAMEGVSLFRAGKPAEAARLLEKVHEQVSVANVDPKYVLALCYLDTSRYDEARKAFASQYGFGVDSAQAYLLEARMLLRRDYLPAAEAAARKAIELNPSLPGAHLALGEIALAQQDLAAALSEFEEERTIDPLNGAAYERMGDAYIRAGEFARAQQVLDEAVLLEPKISIPYILLSKVLLKQQNPLMAKMYLEHALQMDPNNSMAHFLLGQTYRSLGQNEAATREFEIVAKIHDASTPKLESAE